VASEGSRIGGTLKLVRPTFTNDTCSNGNNCGSNCFCLGNDASKCVGCTCKKGTAGDPYFYCNATSTRSFLKIF